MMTYHEIWDMKGEYWAKYGSMMEGFGSFGYQMAPLGPIFLISHWGVLVRSWHSMMKRWSSAVNCQSSPISSSLGCDGDEKPGGARSQWMGSPGEKRSGKRWERIASDFQWRSSGCLSLQILPDFSYMECMNTASTRLHWVGAFSAGPPVATGNGNYAWLLEHSGLSFCKCFAPPSLMM